MVFLLFDGLRKIVLAKTDQLGEVISMPFFVEATETINELLKGPNKANQRIAIQNDFFFIFETVLKAYVNTDTYQEFRVMKKQVQKSSDVALNKSNLDIYKHRLELKLY